MSPLRAQVVTVPPPAFRFTAFFEGPVTAWGVFVDRFGVVRQRLNVRMTGTWHGSAFHLDETFEYATGEREERRWVIKDSSPERFTASCTDCAGFIEGVNGSDAIRMQYDFNLPLGGRKVVVSFVDQLFRLDERRAFNRATMKKFGITLGHVLLFAEKGAL